MPSLLAESWTWFAFALLIVIARFSSRYLQLGSIKQYQPEDYVMLVVFVFYTVLVSCMNIVDHLDTNLMLPGDELLLTPDSIKSRIRGSKLVLVVEQSMIMTIWGCKICLLLMYNKLTFGLKQQLAVKIVAGYVVINFIVMEILYLGVWCRPLNNYWKVPVENTQCSAAVNHLITNAVFNISSDIMMLCIPLPLLITSQLPRTKKLILCGLFGLGVFVILCAVLNKFYSFAHPFSPMWEFWYIREASTAILVANMPNCWSLMRRLFNLRSFNGSSSFHTRSKSNNNLYSQARGQGSRKGATTTHGTIPSRNDKGEAKAQMSWWERESSTNKLGQSESEEHIVGAPNKAKSIPLEIWESKEFDIDRGSVRIGELDNRGQQIRIYDGVGGNAGAREFETKTIVTASASSARRSESSNER